MYLAAAAAFDVNVMSPQELAGLERVPIFSLDHAPPSLHGSIR